MKIISFGNSFNPTPVKKEPKQNPKEVPKFSIKLKELDSSALKDIPRQSYYDMPL